MAINKRYYFRNNNFVVFECAIVLFLYIVISMEINRRNYFRINTLVLFCGTILFFASIVVSMKINKRHYLWSVFRISFYTKHYKLYKRLLLCI